MADPLSLDLRERVLGAIAAGSSGRQAALRFGVSAASVSRWRALERDQGDAKPKAMGGDRRSRRIEAHADLILALVEKTKDMTLEELRVILVGRGSRSAMGRCGGSSTGVATQSKKDRARERAGAGGCHEASPGLV
jgi:hypothetical protein